jgi:pimeloyl-ACP methyl ester carboxylesterase
MRVYAGVALVGVGLLALACTRHTPPERATESHDASPPAVARVDPSRGDAGADANGAGANGANDDTRAPLSGFPEQLELFDGKEKLGFVSAPLGAREARPIMIAIHGGSEKPERACSAWRGVTEAYPFVVCPRGFGGRETALGWRTTSDTKERIARAVAATKKIFPSWIKETDTVVLAGFSMGGSQVALLARSEPQTYRRIVVGDSAHDPQPALTFSRAWVKGGGERAVFLCTTSGCEPSFRAAARNVASEKAPARLNIAATQVHGLSEPVVRSMRRDWPWLVESAEGWETYPPPSDASLPGKTETF